jgi:enediyne biosynthesis protein E3
LTGIWAASRRRILTPSTSQTKLARRGFHEKSPEATEQLEAAGAMFLAGYAHAAEAKQAWEAETGLQTVPRAFRGFAYEGAGMGFAVRDAIGPRRRHMTADLIDGRGADHVYMIYVGVGWALGRLPRALWGRMTDSLPDPVLRWLVLDGYGFHQAYFHTEKYVNRQFTPTDFPWPQEGPAAYANRVIDQGIGRAMWFVHGADPDRLADTIDSFPEARRADLYAGSALAVTYAGGLEESELLTFKQRAGRYAGQVAQASAFAATARVRAGNVIPHTGLATEALCGATPEEAARVALTAFPDPMERTAAGEPAFEVWRQRIGVALGVPSTT